MTTESNDNDPRVARIYRSIATETTPPELDREVLSMAAGSVRSRYGLARAWTRPVAWAATIGLSLAFVLEMTQFGDEATSTADADVAATLEERVIRDETAGRALMDNREQPETAKRSDAPVEYSKPAARKLSSPPAATEPAPKAEVVPAIGSSVSDEFDADDMTRSERTSASGAEALTFDAAISLEAKEGIQHCDEDARSSAAAWFACIEELRAAGLADAAEMEFESLQAEFPDFEASGENR